MHLCLWSTAGFFEILVANTRSEAFVQTTCIPPAGSICCVVLAFWIRSIVLRPYFHVTATTSCSVSARKVINLEVRSVPGLSCSIISVLQHNIMVRLACVALPRIATRAQCSGSFLRSKGNISRMHFRHTLFQVRHYVPRFERFQTKFRTAGIAFVQQAGLHPEY